MNERIRQLADQAIEEKLTLEEFIAELKSSPHDYYGFKLSELEKFYELIVEDIVKLLRQEWYDLNNIETQPEDTPREIALRVGAKSEIIKLMHKIQKHYGVKQ